MTLAQAVTISLIAVGLSIDAFSISVAAAGPNRNAAGRYAVQLAACFGFFQILMPILGALAGRGLQSAIEGYDHWLAFGLLLVVGGRMLSQALHRKSTDAASPNLTRFSSAAVVGAATSFDSLAVGVTLPVVTDRIFIAAIAIGGITFLISWIGWWIGRKIGSFFENKLEIVAGLVVIGIGVKILLEHLFANR
jgi:putative Mn2+ efflux pump MntP